MLIVVQWKGGKGDPDIHRQGVTGPAQMLALAFRLKQLAEAPVQAQEGHGEAQEIPVDGNTPPLKTAAEDAVVLYRQESAEAPLEFEWRNGVVPTAEQLLVASALLDEMGRHEVRKVLNGLDMQQMQREQIARAAIEQVAARPDFGGGRNRH